MWHYRNGLYTADDLIKRPSLRLRGPGGRASAARGGSGGGLQSVAAGTPAESTPYWESTFDLDEQTQPGAPVGTQAFSGDSLSSYGSWLTSDSSYDQITSAANRSAGLGGRGFRHWEGDGVNNNGGGIALVFSDVGKGDTYLPHFWLRWYMRYASGFSWSSLTYDKHLYIGTGVGGIDCIPEFYGSNGYAIYAQGGDGYGGTTCASGWTDMMGGSVSDGLWHCYEIEIQVDTDQTDGVGRVWLDATLCHESTTIDWSGGNATAKLGWTDVAFGSNQRTPNNGQDMAVDFDDISLYTTTPPNVDAFSNPYIGP